MILTIWLSGKGNHRDSKNSVAARGWDWGEMNRWSTENFQGCKNTLYDTVMMDTCHYAFVQTHRLYNIKSEPNTNDVLWVIVMCQCRLISNNKCTFLVGDVTDEEAMRV